MNAAKILADYGFQALFYVYALFGAPLLLKALQATLEEGVKNAVLSAALLASMLLGFAGLRLKSVGIASDMDPHAEPRTSRTVVLFVVWILHSTICVMLAMTALAGLGFDISSENTPAALVGAVIVSIILVEFAALWWMLGVRPRARRQGAAARFAGELCLLAFGCVVYTAYWDSMAITRLNDYTWAVFFFEALAACLLFMIIYLPIKLPELMEEFYLGASEGRRGRLAVMLALGLLVAVFPAAKNTLCEGGRYTSLERALAWPGGVVKLYLGGQGIEALPPEIGTLTNARILRLTDNKLVELPPELGRMRALEELYVGNNNLRALPPEIGMLSNLTVLDAYNNYISSVPPEIGNARRLEILNLSWNALTNLPSGLAGLGDIKKLKLAGNRIPVEELDRFRETGAQEKLEINR